MYGDLKKLVININLSTYCLFCKNYPSTINTGSDITFILYFCTTIFKGYFS